VTRWRLLPPEEYPKPLAQLVKLAKRIVGDDDLAGWLKSHTPSLEAYLEFVDILDEVATQPFYTLEGDLDETG